MIAQSWMIEEVHGIWWAYWGPPRPDDKCFMSHGRPHLPRIIGPFYSKQYAEKIVAAKKGQQ